MGVAGNGSFLRAAQLLLAPDRLRQARHRALRPRDRGADPRAAKRRRRGGHGRCRVRAGGPFGGLRGRPDERPVRGHQPRPRHRAGAPRRHGAHHRGAGLPLGLARRSASRVRRRVHRPPLGAGCKGDDGALRSELRGRSRGGAVHRPHRALGRQPGDGPADLRDVSGHRCASHPSHDPGTDAGPPPARRPRRQLARRQGARRADPRRPIRGAPRDRPPAVGGRHRSRHSGRSRSS